MMAARRSVRRSGSPACARATSAGASCWHAGGKGPGNSGDRKSVDNVGVFIDVVVVIVIDELVPHCLAEDQSHRYQKRAADDQHVCVLWRRLRSGGAEPAARLPCDELTQPTALQAALVRLPESRRSGT